MGDCKGNCNCLAKAQGKDCSQVSDDQIDRVSELYVAVFAIPIGDDVIAENIVFGARYGTLQATVERHVGAVPNMINLCDEIASDKGWPWRLLRFSDEGIQELEPEDFRGYEQYCKTARLQ